MTYFKLDVEKFNDSLSDFKKFKKIYVEDVDLFYDSLKNVDNCWNDENTSVFISRISEDKSKFDDFILNVDMVCNKIENFLDELIKVMSTYGFSTKSCIIKFDDSQLSALKKKLSNAISYLNNALYIINNNLIYSKYKNKDHLYYLRKQLNKGIDRIEAIRDNLDSYVNTILNILVKYGEQIDKYDDNDLNVDNMEYQSNIVDLF